MIGKTNSQTGGALRGEKLNISLKTNQSNHNDLIGTVITITHAGGTTEHVWGGSEFTVEVPPYVEYSVEYGAVEGYATPAKFTTTAVKDNARTLTAEYKTTIVTVNMADNQSSLDDIANATATVAASGITTKTVKTGQSVKVPTGVGCTVTWGALADYKTPSAQTFTTSGTAVAKTGTYQTELVSVTLNADNGASVNGAKVTINGKSHTWNGTAITQKVAFGSTYSVSVGAMEGFVTPSAQNNISASQASRQLTFTYIASALKVNILSNQDNDSDIAAVKATVKYGSTTLQVSSGQQVNIPSNTEISILFPEVEGYLKPNDVVFTYTGGLVEKTGTYQCELLTVNVSADQGSVSGFEVLIMKFPTVGVATKYRRLNYIESNDSQYIDTGFKPNSNTKVEADIQFYSAPNAHSAIFGSRNSNANQFWAYYRYSDSAYSIRYNTSSDVKLPYSATERALITMDKNTLTVNDQSVSSTSGTFSAEYPLALFAANNAGTIQYYGSFKMYSCKIYDNGTLVRDYIPALRSDGIAGLYDAVNDTFYPSKGSSNFDYESPSVEIVAVQTSVTDTYKMPFGTGYGIEALPLDGFEAPEYVTRIASAKSYTVNVEYKTIVVRDLSKFDIYGNAIPQTTANCYVVRETGLYKLPLVFGNALKNGASNSAAYTNNQYYYSHDFVDYKGNIITSPYIENVSGKAASAQLSIADTIWTVNNISIVDGSPCRYLQFNVRSVPSVGSNCVLSIMDSNGVIMWSWHIWIWPDDLTVVEITNSTSVKYNILPVNLASKWDNEDKTTIKNWFYQFGRPNPILSPSAYNSFEDKESHGVLSNIVGGVAPDISNGIQNPTTFYTAGEGSNGNWFSEDSFKSFNLWDADCSSEGNSDNNVVKTVYDPCPVGFKMPNGKTFTYFSTSNVVGDFDGGYKFKRYSDDTVGVFFPASGYRSHEDGDVRNVGVSGYVWLSSAASPVYAYSLGFYLNSVSPQDRRRGYRAAGFSVRPVQE